MWNLCKQPECEAYTARPDGDYCESCRRKNAKESENEKRATEKRAQQIQKAKLKQSQPRPTPNKVSDKQKELNARYTQMRTDILRMRKECEAKVNEYCNNKSETIHHKRGRGKYLLAPETWLPCCMSCHVYIEQHPKEAKEKGWSMSRLAKQKETI